MEIEFDGGRTERTEVDGRDIRRWEAANDKSFLTSDLSYTALTELAGYSAIRTGKYEGKLADFMAEVISVAQVGDSDDALDPTQKEAGDEQS